MDPRVIGVPTRLCAWLSLICLGLGQPVPVRAFESGDRRPVASAEADLRVWLRAVMHFDLTGQARVVEFRNIDGQVPAGFIEALQQRLLNVKLQPPVVGEQAVDWRTGAMVEVEIQRKDDGAGQLTIKQLRFAPLLVRQALQDLPRALSAARAYDHQFMVVCDIDAQGHCDPSIEAPVPMPEPVRKWALDSAKTWLFEPQQLAGQAVPGRVKLPMRLHTPFGEEGQRPIDFRVIDPINRMRSSRE